MPLKIGIEADVSRARGDLDDLMKALLKTGQAGKGLSDIKLDPKQFAEAANQLKHFNAEFEAWKKTAGGAATVKRAEKFGQPVDSPMRWNWQAMYASQAQADKARSQFWFRTTGQEFSSAQVARPPHPITPAHPAAAPGWLARSAAGWRAGRMGLPLGLGAMSSGIGPTIASAAGSASGSLIGGALGATAGSLGGPHIAAIVAAVGAVVAGTVLKKGAEIGYQEHKAALPAFDEVYRKMASTRPWDELTEKIRDLGAQLHMTSSEAAGLASMFQSVSGSGGIGALERAGYAGRFGYSFGMSKMESAHGFAAAEYMGVGSTRSDQRQFATLLAETIAGGSMFARSNQVMEDMLGYIKSSEAVTGRVTQADQLGRYAEYRARTYQNPATRGALGDSFLQGSKGLLKGGGPVREMFLYRTFGKEVGGDPLYMDLIKNADPLQTVREVTGIGDDTRPLAAWTYAQGKKQAPYAYSGSSAPDEVKTGVYLSHMSGGTLTPQQVMVFGEMIERIGESGFGGMTKWAKKHGVDMMKVDPAAIKDLSAVYSGGGDLKELAETYIANDTTKEADRKALEANKTNAVELRKILPGIIASTKTLTPHERDRAIDSELKRVLEKSVGEPVMAMTLAVKEKLTGAADDLSKAAEKMINFFDGKNSNAKKMKKAADTFSNLWGPNFNVLANDDFKDLMTSAFGPENIEKVYKTIEDTLGHSAIGRAAERFRQKAIEHNKKYGQRGRPSESDIDRLTRTVIGEAGPNAPAEEMEDVMSVIVNRMKDKRWSDTLRGVVDEPGQFSMWNEGNPTGIRANKQSVDSEGYKRAREVVERAVSGRLPDTVGGANHYYNPDLANPSWAKKFDETKHTGPHRFLRSHRPARTSPPTAPAGPQAKTEEPDSAFNLPEWRSFYPLPDFSPPKIPTEGDAAVRYNTIPSIADARLGGQIDVNVQQVDELGRRIRQLTKQSFRPEPRLMGTVDVGVLSGSHYHPATLSVD
ncbi:MAG: cell wall hydrolase [Pseudomonadota bacterium]